MPSGRPDYWYWMLPGYSVSGTNQSDILLYEEAEIVAFDKDLIMSYIVAAGYRLHIVSGNISARAPGINEVIIHVSALEYATYMFDQNYNFPISPGGSFVVEAGETLKVYVDNQDNQDVYFYISFHGFLEYKIV